jgi:NADH-quinone oxidoreductase subunit G
MLSFPRKAVVLWGLEPDLDLGDPHRAMEALGQAEFVVAASAFRSPALEAVAHVMLPIASFAETSGTFVNAEGTWQSFQGAVAAPGEARPGWKVLRVLGNLLDLPGFDYRDSAAIRSELAERCAGVTPDNSPRGDLKVEPRGAGEGLIRIGSLPIYALDPLVRRAVPLQRTPVMGAGLAAYLHPEQAVASGVVEGDRVEIRQADRAVPMAVVLDDRVPPGCVRIPAGVPGSEVLGAQIGPVVISKA